MKTMGLVLWLLFSLSFSQKIKSKEFSLLIQLAIDHPELQPYFKLENDSSRLPVVFLKDIIINRDNIIGVRKFGQPIVFESLAWIKKENIKAYFEVTHIQYIEEQIHLNLKYAIEGVQIAYLFSNVNDVWEVTKCTLSKIKD